MITKDSLENAIAAIACSGGSTNGVLHLLAVAPARWASSCRSTTSTRSAERTPLLCDLKPGRPLRRARPVRGRRRAAAAEAPQARPGCCTRARSRSPARPSARSPTRAVETEGQQVVRPLSDPLKPEGGLAILRGNLAPEGCVVKLAGHERRMHVGPARVFESEEDAMAAVTAGQIKPGDVVVIRNEGPAGGPGMREMLAVTAAIVGAGARRGRGADHRRPLLGRHPRVDGRPRRARGGPGRPDRGDQDGDEITSTSTRAAWTSPSPTRRSPRASPPTNHRRARPGVALSKYARLVSSASRGAITL